jgi:hypothetical protein
MSDRQRCLVRRALVLGLSGLCGLCAMPLKAAAAQADAPPPGFLVLATSGQSAVTTAQTAVVRDAAAWSALWARHAAAQTPPLPRPEVDFGRFMVLAVFAGGKPSACHGMQVVSVMPAPGDGLQLRYREPEPPAGMMCASVMTFPAQFVQVPRVSGKVSFSKLP